MITSISKVITDKNLSYHLVEQPSLNAEQRAAMYALMTSNYDHVEETHFLVDLNNKSLVGLLCNTDNVIIGFTTFAINPKQCGQEDYSILFSGDTIIEPQYWGTQILAKGWCFTVGQIIASDISKNWYWYLMSKGHRTYMFLPLFIHSYYPSLIPSQEDDIYKKIANEVSIKLYGHCWKEKQGIIKFDSAHGQLNRKLSSDSYKKTKNEHVNFFLRNNPNFSQGDELVCVAKLELENFKRSAYTFIKMGMEEPLTTIDL